MDERYRKISCFASTEISPPILLRRRLSVPETVMRKHMLAQQRSLSQESDRSQNSEGTQSCNWPEASGSDTNLSRKRDSNIRKSTLIKRFWENSKLEKALQFPRTYSEWQYSFGKLKMSSNSSTPEHIRSSRKSIYDDFINKSPLHRRASTKSHDSPKRNLSNLSINESPKHTRLSQNDDYLMYSSNFSAVTTSSDSKTTTTKTAENNTSETYHMDAPTSETHDSAYTNSYSSFIQTSTPRKYQSPNPITKTYQINSNCIESLQEQPTKMPELPIKYQFVVKENSDNNNTMYEFIPKLDNESTQTNESTNLNVITNVHLSESTLNLIFKQVMHDVLQHKTVTPETVQPSIINVTNIPSFTFQKQPEDAIQKDLPIRNEVIVGSPYKIKGNKQHVPRLSALPRTTSMEVNISSNESMDKGSASDVSLADSLEERGESACLLPDNSIKTVPKKKASVFYIPMTNEEAEVIAPSKDDVSSHFPAKLKEKLLQRQIVREEKQKENKLKSFAPLDCENGNYQYFERNVDSSVSKPKARKKTTLPIIENNNNKKFQEKSMFTQRSLSKYRESIETPPISNKNKSFWAPKTNKKLSPINNKQEEATNSRRFYQKPDKQIEILEIMEIIEPPRVVHLIPKNKSKIPVLVHQKLPKIQQPKAGYLDFEITQNDPKLDQLIANILIDTLNREDDNANTNNGNFPIIDDKSRCNSTDFNKPKHPNLIEQAAEILTKQVLENNNLESGGHKFAESLDPLDHTKIPKGWITFYMLQKNSSPDSTSDEGHIINNKKARKFTKKTAHHRNKSKSIIKERIRNNKKGSAYKTEEFFETETESDSIYKLKKSREKNLKKTQSEGGWSVTISANNSNYDKCAPEVEMRLKFNELNRKTSQDCETNTDPMFPQVQVPSKANKHANTNTTGFTFQESCLSRRVTELNKTKHCLKNPEYTSRLEPRPTKLSMQRCLLHKHIKSDDILYLKQNDNRNYEGSNEYNLKLPEISINGNTYNQKRRNLDQLLNERDFKTYLSQLKNQSP